jgi:phosphoadenosine phosphosulfate reductase
VNLIKKIKESEKVIIKNLKSFNNIFIACSFGKDSRVILDLVLKYKPKIKIFGINTGYEFEETLEFADILSKKLDLNFKWVKPTKIEKKKINSKFGKLLVNNGEYKCCAMKIPVIENLLTTHDAWITGLRRDETLNRADIGFVQKMNGVTKINPIAFWTGEDIWKYIKENKLKYHPLYDKGYSSLGCRPCTSLNSIQRGGGTQGTFERAGRFIENSSARKECGLHLDH